MRNSLFTLLTMPLLLGGCKSKPVVPHITGTWKLDVAASILGDMPKIATDQMAMTRLKFNQDGTYSMAGSKADKGKWTLVDHILTLQPDQQGSRGPSLTVSEDGTELVSKETVEGTSLMFVFVKE